MTIDVIFVALLVIAIFQGYRRGLIAAVFSFIAIVVGLAAAIKLSAVVAGRIGHAVKVSDKWLPILSFALVFIAVVFLIRLGARAIQRLTESMMLGWVNRVGGVILYAALYTTVFSILLFYAGQVKLLSPEAVRASVTYPFIEPWGPKAVDMVGSLIPWFKNMFTELEEFFGGISGKVGSS